VWFVSTWDVAIELNEPTWKMLNDEKLVKKNELKDRHGKRWMNISLNFIN
jgi:hypothetical protein